MRSGHAVLAVLALCGCDAPETPLAAARWSPALAIVAKPVAPETIAEPPKRAVADPKTPVCAPAEPLNVLFIGNSYVIQSDTPALLEAIAQDAGVAFHVERLASGGKDFEYHLDRSETAETLAERDWDVVFLQSHSLHPLRDPDGFAAAGTSLIEAVREADAEPWLFETWARREGHNLYNYMQEVGEDPEEMLQRVADRYGELGEQTGVPVAPVGTAWLRLQAEHPEVQPYLKDGAHPAEAGAYLNAAVIFAELTERDPRSILRPHGAVDAAEVAAIGDVAAAVVDPPCAW